MIHLLVIIEILWLNEDRLLKVTLLICLQVARLQDSES